MPSVVIVHAAEDTPPARALAEKLRALGLTPVVDQNGSDAWRAAISSGFDHSRNSDRSRIALSVKTVVPTLFGLPCAIVVAVFLKA